MPIRRKIKRKKGRYKDRATFSKYASELAIKKIKEDTSFPDQRSLLEQLKSLHQLANKDGLYDAADFIDKLLPDMFPEAYKDKKKPHAKRFAELAGIKDPQV